MKAPFLPPSGKYVILDTEAYAALAFTVGAIQKLCEERGIFTRDDLECMVIATIDSMDLPAEHKALLKEHALDIKCQ